MPGYKMKDKKKRYALISRLNFYVQHQLTDSLIDSNDMMNCQ